MAKAKTINLLLEDGDLNGLLTVEDSSWDGIMFVSPRKSVDRLFEQDETKNTGIYLLISDNEVYIGQASELQRRIKQHDKGKDFWEKAVLITTKDDSLNRSAIDYIEHELIDKAKRTSSLHIENKQSGNKPKVSRFDKVKFDNFMENALLLLELIGIKVFSKVAATKAVRVKKSGDPKPKPVQGTDYSITLSDGWSYTGTSNRDYFLRTIEHLLDISPEKFSALKNTWTNKKGRAYISDHQIVSGKNSPLHSQIKDGSYIYSNQSADSLRKNLEQYLEKFNIRRMS